MLAELFEAVTTQARKTDAVQIVKEFQDGTIAHRVGAGPLAFLQSPPTPRNHKALDLSAIIEFAEIDPKKSAVWYSRSGVVCLTDDGTRRDKVSLSLDYSPQLKLLQRWEASAVCQSQRAILLDLRTTLAGCEFDEESKLLMPSIQCVTFTKNSEGTAEVKPGKASIGKKLTEQATGATPIPLYVTFNVPIFATAFNFTGTVRCAVDVDAGDEKFRLIPLPLQIETAIAGVEGLIMGSLKSGTKAPVRYGSPQ